MATIQTLAYVMKITMNNDEVIGFNSLDFPITIDGVEYKPSNNIDATAVTKTLGLDIDNTQVAVLMNQTELIERYIRVGLLEDAPVEVRLVNFITPPNTLDDAINILSGFIGEVTITNGLMTLEVTSRTQLVNRSISNLATPICPYVFGDSKCGLDLVALGLQHDNVTIDSVVSEVDITYSGLANPIDHARYIDGYITIETGENKNIVLRITAAAGDTLAYDGLLVAPLQPGVDTISFRAACNKTREACESYNNIRRFGGFFVGDFWMQGYSGLLFVD